MDPKLHRKLKELSESGDCTRLHAGNKLEVAQCLEG